MPNTITANVACINSSDNVTISGDEASIDVLKINLDADGIFARKLVVTVAYHSPQMNEIAAEYLAAIQNLEKGQSSRYPPIMISSVTGDRVTPDELRESEYWFAIWFYRYGSLTPSLDLQYSQQPQGRSSVPSVRRALLFISSLRLDRTVPCVPQCEQYSKTRTAAKILATTLCLFETLLDCRQYSTLWAVYIAWGTISRYTT